LGQAKNMSGLETARRAFEPIDRDLSTKMVLLAGPRQCGKTTLAQALLQRRGGAYFNYDVAGHRSALRRGELPEDKLLWVFDELHKLRTWRNWLKGVYDQHSDRHPILVTGSARLDLYGRGGDSLQGRYLRHRLHPFTLSEVLSRGIDSERPIDELLKMDHQVPAGANDALSLMLERGSFPEPFLAKSSAAARRWRLGYSSLIVREELRELEQVRDLDRVELLYDRLPETVGSVLSLNALREDLEVSFDAVRRWVGIFDALYATFRVPPYGPPRIKAVKKEQKLYFWDYARVESESARFENLVLLHLLRLCHWIEDIHGERAELRYLRDVHGREVDAIILRGRKPWLAVEVKLEPGPIDPSLRYVLERATFTHAFQVSLRGSKDVRVPPVGRTPIRLLPAARFLSALP
jgi:uncharacterized protein